MWFSASHACVSRSPHKRNATVKGRGGGRVGHREGVREFVPVNCGTFTQRETVRPRAALLHVRIALTFDEATFRALLALTSVILVYLPDLSYSTNRTPGSRRRWRSGPILHPSRFTSICNFLLSTLLFCTPVSTFSLSIIPGSHYPSSLFPCCLVLRSSEASPIPCHHLSPFRSKLPKECLHFNVKSIW